MGNNENGTKSKIIIFLVSILQTIIMAWCLWMGAGLVDAKTSIAALQANYASIMRELSEIKEIVKR